MNGPRARPLLHCASVIAVLLLWQVLSLTNLLPASAVPSVTDVAFHGVPYFGGSEFWLALGETLTTWAIGLGLVIVLAVVLGLLVGGNRTLEAMMAPLFEFLKPIPPAALIPLTLLLLGPSQNMKITLVVFGALWPLFTQVVYGMKSVEPLSRDMARTYRLSLRDRVVHVYLQSLVPYLATGIRISASIALIIAIVSELVGGAPGIGNVIAKEQSAGNLPVMYALIVFSGLLGLVMNGLFKLAESPLLRGHPSHSRERTT